MSRTAFDTPNAWRTGWWRQDEDEKIIKTIQWLSRKLDRPPSSLVRRIAKLEREGRVEIWESNWNPHKQRSPNE